MKIIHNTILRTINFVYPLTIFGAGAAFSFYKLIASNGEMETWRKLCFIIGGSIFLFCFIFFLVFTLKKKKSPKPR